MTTSFYCLMVPAMGGEVFIAIEPSPQPEIRLLRLADVSAQVGLSRSTIYKRMDEGTFPRPVDLGPNVVRWRSTDIVSWINSLAPAS